MRFNRSRGRSFVLASATRSMTFASAATRAAGICAARLVAAKNSDDDRDPLHRTTCCRTLVPGRPSREMPRCSQIVAPRSANVERVPSGCAMTRGPATIERHVLARVVGGDVGRIAAVIGGDEEQIVVAHVAEERGQLAVERLQRFRVSGRVVAMAVLRIEVDEVREDEIGVRLADQIDRLAHAVGVVLGADLLRDADAVEDVGDLAEADDLLAGVEGALDDGQAGRPDGEVLAVRGALEVSLAACRGTAAR